MATSLELVTKGTNKLAFGIEDEDGRVILEISATLVYDVKMTSLVQSYIVGSLPTVSGR